MAPEAAPLSAATTPHLEFRAVCKRYPGQGSVAHPVTAIENVTFSVAPGEVVSLIGPSGCGKSTVLNLGAGLDAPTEGEVHVAGTRVREPTRTVACMMQKDLLLPWRTIRENVELGLEIQGVQSEERATRSGNLLQRCRLSDFADHYPHQLSGGMRQRGALARTLAVDPTVLLLDEPFSALDAQTKIRLQQDLGDTLAQTNKTALFITHDLVESVTLSDRVLVMSERPGHIIEEIAVDLPERENPLARRRHARTNEYVNHLMSLLHIK